MTAALRALSEHLASRRLIASPQIEDDFVYGLTRFEAIDAEVMLNVDPESAEHPDLDPGDLVARVEEVLDISALDWRELLGRIASEIEEAVGPEPVDETTDLRDDLTLASIVVLVEAVLLSFDAPRQFPASIIRVQLDDELGIEDLEVESIDDTEGTETLTFENVDALLKHLTAAGDGASATDPSAAAPWDDEAPDAEAGPSGP